MTIPFSLLLSLIGIILTIFIVVGIHEGAHFLMARLLGIKVLSFSIGFGKPLTSWHDKKGTEYILAPIPLGGYVKLLDESEGDVDPAERHLAFNQQPLYKRIAVVAAGPISNLIAAVIFYWLVFIIGFTSIIPIIGTVEPHSIASEAGLKPQQEIIGIDAQPTDGWPSIALRLVAHIGNRDTVLVTTKDQTYHLNLDTWKMNDLNPDPLSSLGIMPYLPKIPLIIAVIKPGSPAATEFKVGDKIIAINGKAISNWDELLKFIDKHPDQTISFTLIRDNKKQKITLTLDHKYDLFFKKHGFLGVSPQFTYPDNLLRKIQYNALDAIPPAVKEVADLSYLNLLLFGKLITHKLSLLSLGGPITIFQSAGNAFQYGIVPFLGFIAFLNVALGIINFFPIPGLDGGHLFFQLIELIIRRPVSMKVQMLCYRIGFIFLFLLLAQALTNDLMRLWG